MDTKRFEVRAETDIDPTQHTIWDTVDDAAVVRYADKKQADKVCADLNDNLK